MASTRSVRQGQVEIGIIEHEGREFTAFGATVCGRHITGYTRKDRNGYQLTAWNGETKLACRSEVVRTFWTGAMALMFRLARGRFIVGYVLGDGDGTLFRGELVDGCSEDEARQHAIMISESFAELDAEDEEAELAET